jgi:hypothetical protein
VRCAKSGVGKLDRKAAYTTDDDVARCEALLERHFSVDLDGVQEFTRKKVVEGEDGKKSNFHPYHVITCCSSSVRCAKSGVGKLDRKAAYTTDDDVARCERRHQLFRVEKL